eukprot:Colp12_sorted_trinity150504_noHs@26664
MDVVNQIFKATLPESYFALFGLAIVAAVGLKFSATVLCAIWVYFLRPGKNLKKVYGEWAVVTGSTDGIGKAYAEELARKGLNIVLIARDNAKLAAVSKEIEEKYKVKVKTVSIDFNKPDTVRSALTPAIADLQVGVLVNNVGVSYDHPELFDQLSEEHVQRLINVNVTAATTVTHAVLPKMVQRKTGAIVNVASAAALAPTPLLAVYSATKAYLDFFSLSLAREYAPRIHVQSVLPFFVVSKLSKFRRASLFIPSPKTYARHAVAKIGFESRTTGYPWHAIQAYLADLLPALFAKIQYSNLKATRVLALKKKAKQQ